MPLVPGPRTSIKVDLERASDRARSHERWER